MDWETIVFTLLLLLVAMNAIVGYMENYIYVGVDASGNPVPFRLSGNFSGSSYSYTDINALHSSTSVQLPNVVSDDAPTNIWGIATTAYSSFTAMLGQIYNLGTGYQRLIGAIFSPLNSSATCSTQPIQPGCIGTGLATILNTILLIPIIVGIIYFIRFILQTVGIAK